MARAQACQIAFALSISISKPTAHNQRAPTSHELSKDCEVVDSSIKRAERHMSRMTPRKCPGTGGIPPELRRAAVPAVAGWVHQFISRISFLCSGPLGVVKGAPLLNSSNKGTHRSAVTHAPNATA